MSISRTPTLNENNTRKLLLTVAIMQLSKVATELSHVGLDKRLSEKIQKSVHPTLIPTHCATFGMMIKSSTTHRQRGRSRHWLRYNQNYATSSPLPAART